MYLIRLTTHIKLCYHSFEGGDMGKNISRPLLLTGLILSLLCYVVIAVTTAISIAAIIPLLSASSSLDPTGATTAATVITGLVGIIIVIFSILGLIFSAVGMSRCKLDAETFSNRKGIVITTIVFNILTIILLAVGIVSTFSIWSLIEILVLVLATIFIIVDVAKNKKYLNNNENIVKTEAIENQEDQNKE